MKKFIGPIFFILFVLLSNVIFCQQDHQKKQSYIFCAWTHGQSEFNEEIWNSKLENYKSIGISEILISGSPLFLQQLVQLAERKEMKVHAWIWTLNRPNDSIAMLHPDWYAVNRNGQNSLEYRAYVDYYQWLSPFHPDARKHIKNNVRKYLSIEGLASVHLDYVRYPDVILGADLQPKYGLVQDREMPEYDYDYHPLARQGFKDIFGKDPIEMKHPELSTEWRQFRLNAITSLVNEIVEMAHEQDTKITAAVFPFPEMSRQMVRQAWNDWNLDAAYPMLYHNFYRENINWIGFATEQGVLDVDFPIYPGVYVPGLKDPAKLEEAIRIINKNGANGVTFFTAESFSDAHNDVLIRLKKEFGLE